MDILNKDKMFKVLFKKIRSNHSRLRSEEVIGYCYEVPSEWKNFILFSDPFTKGDGVRQVNTSIIVSVKQELKKYTLTTMNGSVYSVEILEFPKGTC